jgi:hypothetical protein
MNESYEPSPLEIWRRCFDIQATWTRDDERERREAAKEQWHPPGRKRVPQIGASSGWKFNDTSGSRGFMQSQTDGLAIGKVHIDNRHPTTTMDQQALIDGLNHDLAGEYQAVVKNDRIGRN